MLAKPDRVAAHRVRLRAERQQRCPHQHRREEAQNCRIRRRFCIGEDAMSQRPQAARRK